MKNLLLHGIYLSIIAVLSYFLYDKTKTDAFVFEKASAALATDYDYLDKTIDGIKRAIKTNVDQAPHKKAFLDIAEKSDSISKAFEGKIIDLFKQKNIKNQDISNLRNEAIFLTEKLQLSTKNHDYSEILNRLNLSKLCNDNQFWATLKSSKNSKMISMLNVIKNYSINDKIVILNYCLDKSTPERLCNYSRFDVIINPKKNVVVEGEKMVAEIQLGAFSLNSKNITYEINSKKYESKEGKVFFEEGNLKVGKHNIIAKATMTNPFTGNTDVTIGRLEYEVLPKCSRDCVQNQ